MGKSMGTARIVRKRDYFKWEFLASQKANLAFAHEIDRGILVDAGDGTGSDQRSPNFAPMGFGNPNGRHQ
jgi:hypothetical protein